MSVTLLECSPYHALNFIFLIFLHRFTKTYQNRADTALPYAMQSEFSRVLASEMVNNFLVFECHVQREMSLFEELSSIILAAFCGNNSSVV